jgi:murein L,D-transpeptidase YafK
MKRIVVIVWLALLALPGHASEVLADRVLVKKSERMLYLLQAGAVIGRYKIALGLAPEGHKSQEGDFRTPEGDYQLTRRLINSDYFMAIQVSYPNPADAARAASQGVEPGGQIMIHGQPGQPKRSAAYYENFDWTDGCIAVSNAAMVDIWQLTAVNTPITIEP